MAGTSTSEAISLLQEFVRLETINPPGNERRGADFLARVGRDLGLEPVITDLGNNRANVTIRLTGRGEQPALIYNGHIDVVPPGELAWTHDPFGAVIEEGRMYGRGTSDMKSGVMAMLLAMADLKERGVELAGDLVLTAVADEEIVGSGALRFVEGGGTRGAGAVIISEPTGFKAYVAEKGTYWIVLETRGQTAHGSMPELGRNAIIDMQAVLGEIMAIELPPGPDPWHGPSTLNIGKISGGVAPNVVPDSCRVELDFRIPFGLDPGMILSEVERAMKRAQDSRPGLDARIGSAEGRVPVATAADHPLVRTVLDVCRDLFDREQEPLPVSYATDASILCHRPAIPFVIIGPGEEGLAHQPDEYVDVAAYLKAIELYTALAERILA